MSSAWGTNFDLKNGLGWLQGCGGVAGVDEGGGRVYRVTGLVNENVTTPIVTLTAFYWLFARLLGYFGESKNKQNKIL